MTLTAGTKLGPYEIEAPWRRRALTARVMDGTESGLRAARLQPNVKAFSGESMFCSQCRGQLASGMK
jgi:hypothetical protein